MDQYNKGSNYLKNIVLVDKDESSRSRFIKLKY